MTYTNKKPTTPGLYLFDGKCFCGPVLADVHITMPDQGLIDANEDRPKKPKKQKKTKARK